MHSLNILSITERNAEDAVDTLRVLSLFSKLLQRFPHSPRLVQSVTQSLFHILTLQRKRAFEYQVLIPMWDC